MSRMDAQARIIQNLAIIRYQLEDLSRAGMYRSRFTEDLVQRALQAVASRPVINLNSESNNFPGIDLRSTDETVGYQVTRHVTKAKYDKTATGVAAELGKNDSRVKHLKDVYVVGLTSVNNVVIRRWAAIESTHDTRIRAIELQSLLDFASMTDDTMLGVDDVIQSFVHNWGRPLRADAEEIRTIVGWLDRPAIRDIRAPEMDWYDMAAAMKGLRRLLAQGVDDHGRPVTRPMSSFRDPYDLWLRKIFRASHSISSMLAPRQRLGEDPTVSEVSRINGHRLDIQDSVTTICGLAGLTPPRW